MSSAPSSSNFNRTNNSPTLNTSSSTSSSSLALSSAGPKFAEKYLGIGKLKPPTIDENKKNQIFPMKITLGNVTMVMDPINGQWRQIGIGMGSEQNNNNISPLSSIENIPSPSVPSAPVPSDIFVRQLSSLNELLKSKENEIENLKIQNSQMKSQISQWPQGQSSPSPSPSPSYESERRALEIEKANIQILHENNNLRYKNKILLSICAQREADLDIIKMKISQYGQQQQGQQGQSQGEQTKENKNN